MIPAQAARQTLPAWLRWAALAWLVIWFAVYWRTWGPLNFLHLCDVAVILACIGLWRNSALLISSQTVSLLLVSSAWAVDAAWRIFLGRHLIGGTEYMFDARYPLWVRLFSLFHLLLPLLLLWAVHRIGYDRRGWVLQSAIALVVFSASQFTPPAENINYAFTDPFSHRPWGPAPAHIAANCLFMIIVVYLPTHIFLKRIFPPPPEKISAGSSN